MSDTFTLGSPLRAAIGLMLLGASAGVLLVSRTIDWGVAWTAVIPALALLVPGWALLQRRSLTWNQDQTLTVTQAERALHDHQRGVDPVAIRHNHQPRGETSAIGELEHQVPPDVLRDCLAIPAMPSGCAILGR